jgi:hypothetical protein
MDAYHRLYETHEANGSVPVAWGLDDPMVRREAILVQFGNVYGVIFDGNFPHTRKTIKSRHETENYEYRGTVWEEIKTIVLEELQQGDMADEE